MPHVFLKRECGRLGIALPESGHYGSGMAFLPRAAAESRRCQERFAEIVREEGQTLLGWRDVPVDHSSLGPTACSSEPVFQQIFIGRAAGIADDMTFERKLYVIRKRIEHEIWNSDLKERSQFYIPSLSARARPCVSRHCSATT